MGPMRRGGGSSSKLHLSLGGVQRGLGRCRRLSPLLYFDDARQRVARALVELLLAVSMVTGSPGACLVQRGGGWSSVFGPSPGSDVVTLPGF